MPVTKAGMAISTWFTAVMARSSRPPAWRAVKMPRGMEKARISTKDIPVRSPVTGSFPASMDDTGIL